MRVALVHDWITGLRGGERVLDEMLAIYPDADLYTLFYEPGTTTRRIDARPIAASPLNRSRWLRAHRRLALPLLPWAIRRLHAAPYDLVVSIHHAVAKAIRLAPSTPHLCYCLTPMRYVWDQTEAYQGRGLGRAAGYPLSALLRRFDRRSAGPEHVTRFVAISRCVAERIERHYDRRASILHPPVDVERFRVSSGGRGRRHDAPYLLVTSFAGYKRADLAVDAAAALGRPLVVVGDGPGRRRVERRARAAGPGGRRIRFLGRVGERAVPELYASCRALLQPQEEDFGIAALEVQAAGRPVIALGRGGATETVRPATGDDTGTGVWFSEQRADALAEAMLRFEAIEERFDPVALREHALHFDAPRFRDGMRWEIEQLLEAGSSCA